jgi:hypothetical protein
MSEENSQSTLAEMLTETMSEPSEHADAILEAEKATLPPNELPSLPSEGSPEFTTKANYNAPIPDDDSVFNPAIHCGLDKKTKAGKYRRKPGRKPGTDSTPVEATNSESGNSFNSGSGSNFGIVDPASDAKQIVFLTLFASQIVGGPEFAPEKGEPEEMEKAWTDYLTASGTRLNFPLWMPPLILTGMYVGKRLPKPTVQERLAKVGKSIAGYWNSFRRLLPF